MTDIALALIVASALMHAVWNLLLKRSNNPEIFTWWLLTTGSIIFLPLAVVLFITRPIEGPGWWFVLGTVVIHSAYFTTLARSYAQSDFSLVYPIARGLGPSLVPIIGTVVLNEVVAIPAAVGIGLVVSGIATGTPSIEFNRGFAYKVGLGTEVADPGISQLYEGNNTLMTVLTRTFVLDAGQHTIHLLV